MAYFEDGVDLANCLSTLLANQEVWYCTVACIYIYIYTIIYSLLDFCIVHVWLYNCTWSKCKKFWPNRLNWYTKADREQHGSNSTFTLQLVLRLIIYILASEHYALEPIITKILCIWGEGGASWTFGSWGIHPWCAQLFHFRDSMMIML